MRWTVADLRRTIECGGFEHPERLEWVEGLTLEKMGQNPPHRVTLVLAIRALRIAYADASEILAGSSLPLAATSEPEPNVMVLEVSDASLRKDQTLKAALCATHGIPEHVILDVTNRRAEIRWKPEGEAWGETIVLTETGEFTSPGARRPLRAADLFGEA